MGKPNKVVQALQVLQEEGREDLLQEGMLEQAWVGLRRPKRVSSEGVAAVVIACLSLVHPNKKFQQKSVAGRKVRISPERMVVEAQEVMSGLPSVKMQATRGGMKFTRRAAPLFGREWRPEAGELRGRVRWQEWGAWGCGMMEHMRILIGAHREE
ncbi:hypothetical protein NDU88_002094 [Pleurodeles waltl]|uniref:Uncharacterized protein n=1 Tax=Pleurodeles waltl TaxID=8319 RepID=A0AAV7SBP7_PLEWA|nr:hypothetical protein NDU88_002094 [Pleurodeles waltl]